MEPVQRAEFDTDIAVVLKELEALQLGTSIVDSVVQLTHSNDADIANCEYQLYNTHRMQWFLRCFD